MELRGDAEYANRIVMIAAMVQQLAQHLCDTPTASRLEERYGDQIRTLIAGQGGD